MILSTVVTKYSRKPPEITGISTSPLTPVLASNALRLIVMPHPALIATTLVPILTSHGSTYATTSPISSWPEPPGEGGPTEKGGFPCLFPTKPPRGISCVKPRHAPTSQLAQGWPERSLPQIDVTTVRMSSVPGGIPSIRGTGTVPRLETICADHSGRDQKL